MTHRETFLEQAVACGQRLIVGQIGKRLRIPLLVFVAAASACTNQATEQPSGETFGPAVVSDRMLAAYRDGLYGASDGHCTLTVRDEEHPRRFECGALLVGLQPGMRVDSLADLLAVIAGSVARDRLDSGSPYIKISVPTGTVRDAILRVLADRRVRYAEFNTIRRQPSDR